MEIITKEGKNLEELLVNICEEYKITKNDFFYQYSEKKNGLFNKNSTITLKVYLKKDIMDYVKTYLEELLTNMGLEVKFESMIRDEAICIKIYSNHNPILIGKSGNTLKALETLVKQKINTEFGIRAYINLDVENYREKNQRRLERLAKNVARDVVKTKVEAHLENMNAYDRRIVHNILTDFKGVTTESTGEEPNRHVVIKPE